DAHVTAGCVALSITSCATASLEPFDSNSLNVFAPTCRPDTTPAPVCDTNIVTSTPFSVSLARRSASAEGPAIWINTESFATYPTGVVSVLVIMYPAPG